MRSVQSGRLAWWRTLACTVVAGSVLAACGNSASSSGVTLSIWTYGTEGPIGSGPTPAGWQAITKRYEQLHPSTKLSWHTYSPGQDPSTYQSLLTAIAGGKQPDLAAIDRFVIPEFAAKGVIQPIESYVSKDSPIYRQARVVPGASQEQRGYDGKFYGITYPFEAVGFWSLCYNKDLLGAAGITNPPSTWQELTHDAARLTSSSGGNYTQLGYEPYPDAAAETYTMVYSNKNGRFVSGDGKTASLTSSQVVAAVSQFKSVMDAEGGYESVTRFASPGANTPASQDPFFTGRAAMANCGDWFLQTAASVNPRLHIGVAPYPSSTGGKPYAWAGGFSMQIVKGAPHAKEAAQFSEWLTTEDATATYLKAYSGYNSSKHLPNVLVGVPDFTYPSLVQQYSGQLKADSPDIYQGLLHFINTPREYAGIHHRDRTRVPGELWRDVGNAAQNTLFQKMTASQALEQQNGLLQHSMDTAS